eukprot:SAG25_NODE_752_length_5570_cov_9.068726_3_plen_104_part_00
MSPSSSSTAAYYSWLCAAACAGKPAICSWPIMLAARSRPSTTQGRATDSSASSARRAAAQFGSSRVSSDVSEEADSKVNNVLLPESLGLMTRAYDIFGALQGL